MRRDVFVSLIVPLDNDADILPTVVEEIATTMRSHFGDYEIIFVDDGSLDATRAFFERAKTTIPSFRYVRLTRSFGFEIAIACGLELAIGDVIVVMNPGSDPPECIPRFVQEATDIQGIVIGVRSDKSRRSLLDSIVYQIYFFFCKVFLARTQLYGATHFIALTRTALNALLMIKDSFRYIRVLAMYTGFEVAKVAYEFKVRRPHEIRRNRLSLLADAWQMIVTNSDRPLRAAATVSVIAGVVNFAFLFYIVSMRFLWSNVQPGWASTNFFNAIMFGIMLIVLAVLCEYVAQMRGEVKRRPLYVIQDEMQSNVMAIHSEMRNVVADESRVESPVRTGID